MENERASNPSFGKSAADDLIEEMSRLMAESSKGQTTPSDRPQTHSTPSPRVSDSASAVAKKAFEFDFGLTRDGATAAPSGQGATSSTSTRPSERPGEPATEAGWMPRSIKPEPTKPEPVSVPRQSAPTSASAAPAPRPASGTMSLDDLINSQRASEEPKPASSPAPKPERPFALDLDFGQPKQKREPDPEPISDLPENIDSDDLIAQLIQAQADEEASAVAPAPAPQPTADDFSVPPVFGVNPAQPAKLAPTTSTVKAAGADALDDLEELIGKAVRLGANEERTVSPAAGMTTSERSAQAEVEAGSGRQPTQQPTPEWLQRSSAAPATPEDREIEELKQFDALSARAETDDNVSRAEAAIMAAMQGESSSERAQPYGATPRIDDPYDADESPILEPRTPAWRRALVPVLALLLLGVIGVSAYSIFTQPTDPADAPIIVANTDPTKAEPSPEDQVSSESAESVVLDGQAAPESEQLVSRDQSEETVDPIRQIISSGESEIELANRKVRTVTVRPDGTIITGDDQAAGTEVLSVEQPQLPDLPETANDSELADTTVASLTGDDVSSDIVTETAPEAAPEVASTIDDTTVAPVNVVTVDNARVPFPRPTITDREAKVAAANANVATQPAEQEQTQSNTNSTATDLLANTTTSTPTVTSSPATSAPAHVQLASQRSQAAADETIATLNRQFGSLFGGRSLEVERADLGDRGVFYRILLPANSLNEASTICTAIQNAGGNCFPRNN